MTQMKTENPSLFNETCVFLFPSRKPLEVNLNEQFICKRVKNKPHKKTLFWCSACCMFDSFPSPNSLVRIISPWAAARVNSCVFVLWGLQVINNASLTQRSAQRGMFSAALRDWKHLRRMANCLDGSPAFTVTTTARGGTTVVVFTDVSPPRRACSPEGVLYVL